MIRDKTSEYHDKLFNSLKEDERIFISRLHQCWLALYMLANDEEKVKLAEMMRSLLETCDRVSAAVEQLREIKERRE